MRWLNPPPQRTAYLSSRRSRARSCAYRNLRPGPRDPPGEPVRVRRDAAHVLQEVQDDPLGRQQRPNRPPDPQQRRPLCVAEAALDDLQVKPRDLLDPQPLVVRAANHLHDRQPARDADLLLDQRPDPDRVGRHHQPAGHVVPGAEVLAVGELDQVAEVFVARKQCV